MILIRKIQKGPKQYLKIFFGEQTYTNKPDEALDVSCITFSKESTVLSLLKRATGKEHKVVEVL